MTQPTKTHPLHVSQAIRTKYHGPTDTRGAYYSATASRGRTRIAIDYELNDTQRHAAAAEALKAKFTAEDAAHKTHPTPPAENPWARPTTQGALPDGTHAHTYPEKREPTGRTWLWPDRPIGKRESRQLREEHNKAINAQEGTR
jgi:hypothetical protein